MFTLSGLNTLSKKNGLALCWSNCSAVCYFRLYTKQAACPAPLRGVAFWPCAGLQSFPSDVLGKPHHTAGRKGSWCCGSVFHWLPSPTQPRRNSRTPSALLGHELPGALAHEETTGTAFAHCHCWCAPQTLPPHSQDKICHLQMPSRRHGSPTAPSMAASLSQPASTERRVYFSSSSETTE